MKKILVILLLVSILAGCGAQAPEESRMPAEQKPGTSQNQEQLIRVAALKGPTAIGLVSMMDAYQDQTDQYQFSLYTGADEIVPLLVKGEIDVALIPANVAATLYQKTKGQIRAIGINTLSVLEVVTADGAVQSVADLAGKKLYMTGKSTTPEFTLQYLLEKNGLSMDDLQVEFKSEATEVVAALAQDPQAVGVLPQPFATVATMQNASLKIALHFGEEWDKAATDGSRLVTGVTVARTSVTDAAIERFLEDHAASVQYVNGHPEEAAVLVEQNGIVKAAVAQKAIPNCSIVSLIGDEMKKALSGYLDALYQLSPESIGGRLPDENFYIVDPVKTSP